MFGDFKTSKISEIEERIIKYWQEKKIFEKSVSRKAPKGDYVFYDGPPFATGLPHLGHILAGTIKDVIPRYETMKGHRVERKWGWDCHGLPIENLIEQKLGLKTKKDIEKLGIGKFNAEARASVLTYENDWKNLIPKTGRWVDMDNAYHTMDPEYTESVWWVFKTLFDKKLIYEGYKSMHICPRCETTLSNFEVSQGYKDIEDSSVVIKFELEGEKNTYILAWTTTPWTLPGNVALAVNPKAVYAVVEQRDLKNKYIVAKDLVSVMGPDHMIAKKIKGSELVGKSYKPLFNYYSKDKKLENHKNGWKIYGADFVALGEGTGIVHIAPAFGADDMALGKKYKLPFVQHVGMDGKFKKEAVDFTGLPAKPKGDHGSTDKKIIGLLSEQGKIFKSEKINHSYPHCWRCETPLLNYAASSWFVDVTAVKNGAKGLVQNNKKVNWIPDHLRDGRFGKILEEAPDWAISRSRYWGAPLPVWKCVSCSSAKVVGSVAEIGEASRKSGNNYFVMRHGQAENNIRDISSNSLKSSKKYPLTDKGKGEVLQAAKKLAQELKGKKPDLIFASDFRRTKETAEIVAGELLDNKKKVIFDKRLREYDTGVFDDKDIFTFRKFMPSVAERFYRRPDKGENLFELKNRITGFLYEIDAKYKNKTILIVSHEYPLWLLAAGTRGADVKKTLEMKEGDKDYVKTGEVRRLDFALLPHNENYELELHRPYIDEVEFKCHCGGEMKRVSYVFDCWFESGSMPYGQAHYPFENKKKFESNFPAEFIAEGLDQTRGWFYTLHVLGTALFGKPAFKNVIVNGIILAEDGQKMSKRLKNYTDPFELVGRYGADALRYYLLSSPVVRAEDLNFSDKGVDEIYKKLILRLLNTYSFFATYSDASSEKPKTQTTNILDLWIKTKLQQLIFEITKAMDSYRLDEASRPIAQFVEDFSTWYIRRSRERFRVGGSDKAAALATSRYVFEELAKAIAPFMPFLAEWLFAGLQGGNLKDESVHLLKWPGTRKLGVQAKKLLIDMDEVRRLASLGLEAREKADIKVRQPLATLRIKNKDLGFKNNKDLLKILADEVNIKEIVFDLKIKGEVEIDTQITPELKAEGIIRELGRAVQDLRQKASLTHKNKIHLWLEAPRYIEEAVNAYKLVLETRVGAKTIEFGKSDKFEAESEIQIDSQKIWIGLKKT